MNTDFILHIICNINNQNVQTKFMQKPMTIAQKRWKMFQRLLHRIKMNDHREKRINQISLTNKDKSLSCKRQKK